MSSFGKCKSYSHFFSKSVSTYAIFNDQSFNDRLTKDIVSFEQQALMLANMVVALDLTDSVIKRLLCSCKSLVSSQYEISCSIINPCHAE